MNLNDEQRARIERNRLLALQRKQQRAQGQMPTAQHLPPRSILQPPQAGYRQEQNGHNQPNQLQTQTRYSSQSPASFMAPSTSSVQPRDSYPPSQQRLPPAYPPYHHPQQGSYGGGDFMQSGRPSAANFQSRSSLGASSQQSFSGRVSDSAVAVVLSGSPASSSLPKRPLSESNFGEIRSAPSKSARPCPPDAAAAVAAAAAADPAAAGPWGCCGNSYAESRDRCKKCRRTREESSTDGTSAAPISIDGCDNAPSSAPSAVPNAFAAMVESANSSKSSSTGDRGGSKPSGASRVRGSGGAQSGASMAFFNPRSASSGGSRKHTSSSSTTTKAPRKIPFGSGGGGRPSDEVDLSEEQKSVMQLVLDGSSLFFTGNAGTGKSTLLRSMIKALKFRHGDESVAVTASTGAAATLLSGTTIHSFSGCGIAVEPVDVLAKKVSKNRNTVKRWQATKVRPILNSDSNH